MPCKVTAVNPFTSRSSVTTLPEPEIISDAPILPGMAVQAVKKLANITITGTKNKDLVRMLSFFFTKN
jgi:hypothetical protein